MSEDTALTASNASVLDEAAGNSQEMADGLWASKVADRVLQEFPDEPLYTCAAGTSPSGVVHFGNFRDIMTSYAVAVALRERGKNVRLLFSWDNFDRFRKVPAGVDPSFAQHIGKPLTAVPSPDGKVESYARYFELPYEESLRKLGIEIDYRYQTKMYQSGVYAEQIAFMLENRVRINDILLSFMTDKANQEKGIDPAVFRQENYALSVYSRFTGKDRTQIISYDGGTKLTYRCLETGKEEQIDFKQDPIVKLAWKSDWAMRWEFEKVHFEPSGKDHMTPGGGYDVNAKISREIFKRTPPVPQIYQFVGIQGIQGKMSGSKGNALSLTQLLDIYDPALLKWLYLRRTPTQSFNLAFDTEVYRQYDEFDRELKSVQSGEASIAKQKIMASCGVNKDVPRTPIAFKQAVALGQITQWQNDKVLELAQNSGVPADAPSIAERLPKAHAWLERYNPHEIISLRDSVNTDYAATMDDKRKTQIKSLLDFLGNADLTIATLDETLYAIPKDPALSDKELKVAQRAFFKDVYNLLIGKDTGPRLSTFLWAVDRKTVLKLLAL